MLNALMLAWVASSPPQEVVKLDIAGQRLEVAAPALVKALGWSAPVSVAPNIRNDVVVIKSVDATPKELREQIESTLGITFEERKEGILITQSGVQKQTELKKNKELRFEQFNKALKAYQKRSAALKPFDEQTAKALQKQIEKVSKRPAREDDYDYRAIENIDRQSPTERFFARLTNRLSADLFAGLTEDQPVVVYSTKPNPAQKPLAVKVDDLLNLLRQEQEIWATFGGSPVEKMNEEGYGEWIGRANYRRTPFKSSDFDNCILRARYGTTLSLEFEVFNSEGRRTFESGLSGYFDSEEATQEKPKTEAEYKAEFESKKVPLTGTAKELMDSIGYWDPNQRKKKISPELINLLIQPETTDPLSILATQVVKATAKNRNIVAALDDQSFAIPYLDLSEKQSPWSWSLRPKMTDRWLTVSINDPVQARRSRSDRKAMGQVFRFMAQNNRPLKIEEKAGYVSAKPFGERNIDLQDQISGLIVRSPYADWSGLDNAYRIYGKLSNANRTLSVRKEGVKVSSLADEAKLELIRAIYFGERWSSRLDVDYEAIQKLPQQEQEKMHETMNLIYDGKLSEPTFAMSNGLQNDFIFKSEVERKDVLFLDRPVGSRYGGNRTMTTEEFGSYLFKKTNPKRYRWEVADYNQVDENSIQVGTQRTVTMQLYISPIFRYNWSMTEAFYKDEKSYTASNLPDDLKKKIKEAYDAAEKEDKENGSMYDQYSQPRNTAKPPPL
jgi:hypothetical protein